MESVEQSKRRVLIVDDHPLLRRGVAQLVNDEEDFVVCAEVDTASKALEVVERDRPDVGIVDISLVGTNGIELIKNLRAIEPDLPLLVLSMHDEGLYAERVLRAGGKGYLMKHEAPEKLIYALRRVLDGWVYVSEKMNARLVEQHVAGPSSDGQPLVSRLSDRELEVFQGLGRGLSTRQVAEQLRLSVKTIESHRAKIKEKLGVKSGSELVCHAVQWVQTQG